MSWVFVVGAAISGFVSFVDETKTADRATAAFCWCVLAAVILRLTGS